MLGIKNQEESKIIALNWVPVDIVTSGNNSDESYYSRKIKVEL